MPIVTFHPSGATREVERGTNLFRATRQAGLPLAASCDAELICGQCNLEVVEGAENLSPPSAKERRVLDGERCYASDRLACGAKVLGNCAVRARYW